jgi:hypothetical protein
MDQSGSNLFPVLLLAAFMVTPPLASVQQAAAQGYRDESAANRPGRGRWGRGRAADGGQVNRGADSDSRAAARQPASPAISARSPTSFGTVSDADRISKQASDLIRKHDTNGNHILEGDELKLLGMSRGADKNGDQKVTKNELVAFYTPRPSSAASTSSASTPAPTSPSSPSTAGSSGEKPIGGETRKLVNNTRRSYRFKSVKERLKSWRFASRDANGDGQVAMNEYSRSWSDRTAAEFQRYDRDNDGMITPDEAR